MLCFCIVSRFFNFVENRAQLSTSLKADLRQDINEVLHLVSALMEHILEGNAPLSLW